jgi:hypothetical protein
MDFSELNIKFGSQSVWTNTNKCGWCEKKLKQTQEQYIMKGNICSKCSSMITNSHFLFKDRAIREIEFEIKMLRREMEVLGAKLDFEITEEERKEIEGLMMLKFDNIKKLEKNLMW